MRGKVVAFDRSLLNHFYGLEDIKYDEYLEFVSDHVDFNEIVNTICKLGPQWKMSNGEATSVKMSTLTKEAKIWHYFVGVRFMRSSYLNDVTRDQAILIYCIISGKTINVGSHACIYSTQYQRSISRSLFPLSHHRVVWESRSYLGTERVVIQPVHAIDTQMMLTVKGWDGDTYSSGTSTAEQQPQPQPQKATTMVGRLEHLENEFRQFCTYQRGCNQALAQMMQTLALYMGVNMETFLTLHIDPSDITHQDAGPSTIGVIEEEEKDD